MRTKVAARRFLIGIGSLAMMCVLVYGAFTAHSGRLPGTPATTVRAVFNDVGQLNPGAQVRQNGLTVGQVVSITLMRGKPMVTMSLTNGSPMYRDGNAGIWDSTSLAQKYVQLSPGHPASGLLGDAALPVDQTESTHDLVEVLDVFDPATRAALGEALRQLGGGLAGYGPGLNRFVATLPSDLNDVGTISAALVSEQTNLPGLLRSADRLNNRFTGRDQQITELLRQTDATLRAFGVDNTKPLGDTVVRLPQALSAVRTALDDADQPLADVAVATGDLRSGAGALGTATPNVRGVFREAPAPFDRVPSVASDAKPAVDDLRATLSDAQPFASKLADGLSLAAPPLKSLAPHATDLGTFFFDLSNGLASHDGWQHQLRIMIGAPGPGAVVSPYHDTNDPYPAPGQALRNRDSNGGLLPGK